MALGKDWKQRKIKPVRINFRGRSDTHESHLPLRSRACLKIHSRHQHAPLCGIFGPNSLNVAHYAAFIWAKSPTKWNAQLPESNFQTHFGVMLEEFTFFWNCF